VQIVKDCVLVIAIWEAIPKKKKKKKQYTTFQKPFILKNNFDAT